MALEPPIPAAADYTVKEDDLATSLESGDVDVLATPRVIAWCEAQTMSAVAAVSYTHLTLPTILRV